MSISLIFLSLLEFIGIGSIPVFLSVIIDPNILLDHINSPFIFNIINENEKSDLILFSSVFLILVFLTKNLIYVLIIYFQGILTKRVKLYLSSKIYKKYLDSNYLDFINKNSAMMIRTLNMDVGNTSIFVLNIINLMRETTIFYSDLHSFVYCKSSYFYNYADIFWHNIFTFFFKPYKKIFSQGLSLQFLTSDKIKIIYNTIGSIKEVKILKLENFLKKKFFENVKEFEKFAFKKLFCKIDAKSITRNKCCFINNCNCYYLCNFRKKYFRFIAVIIPNCCFDDKNSSRIEFDTEFFIDFKNHIAFLQSCIIRIIKR